MKSFASYFDEVAPAALSLGKDRGEREIDRLWATIGAVFDEARENIVQMNRMMLISRAEGDYLDRHGADRLFARIDGESDDDYRTFLLGSFDRYLLMGHESVMIEMLARYGFTATISERWEGYGAQGPDDYDREDWNVFDVLLTATTGAYPENEFFNLLRRTKPAHAVAEFEFGVGIEWETFDDWDAPAPPETFDDEGTFDDF